MLMLFSLLILLNLVLHSIYLLIPVFDTYLVGDSERYILTYSGYGKIHDFPNAINWIFVILLSLGMFGMYFCVKYSRMFFSCFTGCRVNFNSYVRNGY